MKILLVDPPGKNKGLNTGLGYLSAFLDESHEVRVLDLNNIEMGICGDPNPDLPADDLEKRVISALDEFNPGIVGISVKTFTVDTAKNIFKIVKERQSEIITMAGGPHITLDGLNFIRENKIDFGVQGEGEYSTVRICNFLSGKGDIEDIEGIIYWRDGQLLHNKRGDTIKDLDGLPFPHYDNFSSVVENGGSMREYPLLTSRGCPYKCTYCSMPKIMGGKWRFHTPGRVIDELRHAKQKYQSKSFAVVDDNFTLNLKRVENICNLLISEEINLSWNCQNGIRADRIREDMAKKMKQSGCKFVWIGIENADDEVFNNIHKGEKLEDIQKGIKHLKDAGIRVGGFFITGLPYSTREADLKSVDFVKENGIDAWCFNFVPYPYTEAWEWVQTYGKILRPIHGVLQYGSNDMEPVFETDNYPGNIRKKTYDEIHIRMRYFDRLADPSLKQSEKWRRVFKKVSPYGYGTVLSLLIFIIQYNARLLMKKMHG
jgi:radical SAM superfamily enzyme YgiQ (UPF0313 family)